jgi:hypothetical protein
MAYKPAEAKAVSTSFQGFLWGEIKVIREAQREGEMITALSYACSLATYLPPKVKDQLASDIEEIAKLINKSFSLSSSDFQSTMLLRNRSVDNRARFYLSRFMDKMLRALYETGIYIEYIGRPIPVGQEIT